MIADEFPPDGQDPGEAERWLREAEENKNAGRSEQAIQAYQRALELRHPKHLEVRRHLGRLLYALHRLDEARQVFEEALANDPGPPERWMFLDLLGVTCHALGESEPAIRHFQEAAGVLDTLTQRPDDLVEQRAVVALHLATVFYNLERYDEAIAATGRVLGLADLLQQTKPDGTARLAEALRLQGQIARYAAGDLKKARELFQRAHGVAPGDPKIGDALEMVEGTLAEQRQEPQEASRRYLKVLSRQARRLSIELPPLHDNALDVPAILAAFENADAERVQAFGEVLISEPLMLLAGLYASQEKAENHLWAFLMLAVVVRLNQVKPRFIQAAHNTLSDLRSRIDPEEAGKRLEAARAYLRGLSLEQANEPARSEQEFQSAIRLHPGDFLSMMELGRIAGEQARYDEAYLYLADALDLAQQAVPDDHLVLWDLLRLLGQVTLALEYSKESLDYTTRAREEFTHLKQQRIKDDPRIRSRLQDQDALLIRQLAWAQLLAAIETGSHQDFERFKHLAEQVRESATKLLFRGIVRLMGGDAHAAIDHFAQAIAMKPLGDTELIEAKRYLAEAYLRRLNRARGDLEKMGRTIREALELAEPIRGANPHVEGIFVELRILERQHHLIEQGAVATEALGQAVMEMQFATPRIARRLVEEGGIAVLSRMINRLIDLADEQKLKAALLPLQYLERLTGLALSEAQRTELTHIKQQLEARLTAIPEEAECERRREEEARAAEEARRKEPLARALGGDRLARDLLDWLTQLPPIPMDERVRTQVQQLLERLTTEDQPPPGWASWRETVLARVLEVELQLPLSLKAPLVKSAVARTDVTLEAIRQIGHHAKEGRLGTEQIAEAVRRAGRSSETVALEV